jgi:glycosyltransferase involved in cell wall biosynthesis
MFQGYGAPGNPVVTENVRRADLVLATSGWLVEAARRHGSEAILVPYGIDRDLFRPGRPAEAREPTLAMLVHRVPWKGTMQGLEALWMIRAAVPEVDVQLFGESRPPGGLPFLPSPSRAAVGDLLRQAAAYVCPSWEEGFGMPGLEALACGASLVTTDTKGSRDYALPGETALVSAPLDVDALAANAVMVLRDAELRGRLARTGQEYVAGHFGTWTEAADRLAAVLQEVV